MALRKSIVKRVEIPHEEGHWMELKLLGWRHLEVSKRVKQAEQFRNIREMGKDVFAAIQQSRGETDKNGPADPLAEHDLMTLLEKGVIAWSYDEPVSPETLGELDEQTAEWAARVILGVTETEAERKNSYGSSIVPSTAGDAPPTSGF